MNLAPDLSGKRILLVGGTSGIALEIARQATAAGAEVVLAGRDPEKARSRTLDAGLEIDVLSVDLGDESSIEALAAKVGTLDAVVSLASNPANGPLAQLEPAAIYAAFDAKAVGPLLLAKHLTLAEDAAMVLFSGVAADRPAPGLAVMAVTNAAVRTLAEALALELAPRRAVAISPGIIDSGAWDGANHDSFIADTAASLPVGRVGHPEDVAALVLATIANPFVNATTLQIDGGAPVA